MSLTPTERAVYEKYITELTSQKARLMDIYCALVSDRFNTFTKEIKEKIKLESNKISAKKPHHFRTNNKIKLKVIPNK